MTRRSRCRTQSVMLWQGQAAPCVGLCPSVLPGRSSFVVRYQVVYEITAVLSILLVTDRTKDSAKDSSMSPLLVVRQRAGKRNTFPVNRADRLHSVEFGTDGRGSCEGSLFRPGR
jgi:hypothetical protein